MKLVLVLAVVLVTATTTAPIPTAKAGLITPDNPLYFLDQLWDNVYVWVMEHISPMAGLQAMKSVIEERIAEAELMAQKNETGLAMLALADAEHYLNMSADLVAHHPELMPMFNETMRMVKHEANWFMNHTHSPVMKMIVKKKMEQLQRQLERRIREKRCFQPCPSCPNCTRNCTWYPH